MNIEQRKYQFIEEYMKIYNLDIIEKLEQLLKEEKARQDNLELDDNIKEAIDKGIKSLDEGKGIPHEQVMKKMKKKYRHLKFD